MYFIIFVVILVVAVIVIYNTMLSKKNKLLKAYSSLDVMLKKRYDLIPNLVECVKGYSEYESNTLNKIISLRKVADECNNAKELESVNNQYNDYEGSIYMLAEKYPDLKANEKKTFSYEFTVDNTDPAADFYISMGKVKEETPASVITLSNISVVKTK